MKQSYSPDDLSEGVEEIHTSDTPLSSQIDISASIETSMKRGYFYRAWGPTHQANGWFLPLSSVKQTTCPDFPGKVVQVQLDFSTVTRSVYSRSGWWLSQFLPEEQKSVIEIPTAPMENVPSTESKSKIPVGLSPFNLNTSVGGIWGVLFLKIFYPAWMRKVKKMKQNQSLKSPWKHLSKEWSSNLPIWTHL